MHNFKLCQNGTVLMINSKRFVLEVLLSTRDALYISNHNKFIIDNIVLNV